MPVYVFFSITTKQHWLESTTCLDKITFNKKIHFHRSNRVDITVYFVNEPTLDFKGSSTLQAMSSMSVTHTHNLQCSGTDRLQV